MLCIDLLSTPDRAKAMGIHGRQRVEKEFTWDAVVQRTRVLCAAIHKQHP